LLNNLGWGELLMLLLIGLLVFGPDQLPKIAGDIGRMIRQLRRMASDVSTDLRTELGSEFDDVDLASLHPRRFIEKHLLADDDDDDDYTPRSPATKPAADRDGSAVGARSISAADDPAPASATAASAVPDVGSDIVPPYDADAT
jgi:sec-independent protein translocase protein TatB